jgi:hypothetical protein
MSQISHRVAAVAQIGLSVLFLLGYFSIVYMFLAGLVRADVGWKEAIIALLGVITGSLGTIVSFWFSRQRSTGEKET